MANKQIQDFDLKSEVDGTEDVLIQDAGVTKRVKTGVLININNNETDMSNYYTKSEVYDKTETYHRLEIDDFVQSLETNIDDCYKKEETYNQSEINELLEELVNENVVPLEENFDNYYTKTEVNTKVSNDLSNYYNKSEVYKKSEVYTKSEVDSEIEDIDLSIFYTKEETYDKTEVDNLIMDVNSSKYSKSETYKKSEVDNLINEVESTHYTKTEVDNLIADVDLSDYYTKEEVNELVDNVSAGDVNLTNYYTKTEVDNLIDDIEVSGGSVDLSNYYTKSETYSQAQVNALISGSSSGGSSSGSGVSSLSLGIVNVKDYGAVGDGVTDDTQAVKNAIAYMCTFAKQCSSDLGWKSYMPTLYFPNGKYVISQKGALNCVGSALQGYNIKGAGYLNSEILYTYDSASDPDGGYLLVNGDDNWFAFSYMEDITFRGNGTNNIWQIKSRDGCPQANRFRRVGFYNLNRCVTVSFGTYNYCADLFRFESCKASEINGWVFGSETNQNSQTVVHTFRDCDFENINGYVIHLKSGGTIEVRGGSWIATQNGRFFHFDDISGAGIGLSNRNVSVYGTKFEFQYYNSSDSNLDYYPLFYNNSRMVLYFHGCNFTQFSYSGNSSIGVANYGYLGIMGSVYFKDCQIPSCFGIKTNPSLSVGMDNVDQKPIIKFTDCIMYNTLDKIVSQTNNNYYQGGANVDVVAEGCYSCNTSNNFHINTQLNQSFGNRAIPTEKKMVVLTNGTNPLTSLPHSSGSFNYKMPQGSIITTITIYFRQTSTSGDFTINVTNSKGQQIATATHNPVTGAKAYRTEVFEVVEPAEGSTSVDYSLTITGVGYNANGGIAGFVAVEYY